MTFAGAGDWDRIDEGDELVLADAAGAVASAQTVTVSNETKGFEFTCRVQLAPRQRRILAAGGLLNYTRQGET